MELIPSQWWLDPNGQALNGDSHQEEEREEPSPGRSFGDEWLAALKGAPHDFVLRNAWEMRQIHFSCSAVVLIPPVHRGEAPTSVNLFHSNELQHRVACTFGKTHFEGTLHTTQQLLRTNYQT